MRNSSKRDISAMVHRMPLSQQRATEDIRFRKLFENSHDGITLLDDQLNVIYRSCSAERIIGWSTAERVKSTLIGLVHRDDQEEVRKALKDLLTSPGKSISCTYRARHYAGYFTWLECVFTNMLDEPGINAVVCNFRDIDARKKAELAEIHALEEKNTILESIGDAFFAVDRNWTVTYWNQVAEKAQGMPKEEIVGRNLWEVYSDIVGLVSYQKYHEAMETNQVVRFEDYYEPLQKWYEVSAFPSANGLSVYFKDISESRRHVKVLEEQYQKLKEISWMQSHVIRAPLARIMGLIPLLTDAEENSREKQIALEYLLISAHELDDVIRSISEKTIVPNHDQPSE